MTNNQSTQLVKNPNTKKAIAVLHKFATIEANYKAAEKEAKEASELIKNAMIEADVPKIEIDLPDLTGYITLAERITYSAENIKAVADEYLKPALDTAKVKAHTVLTGELPANVVETRTQYITKKLKAVE